MADDELWFWYDNTDYQIDHGPPASVCLFCTEYDDEDIVPEQYEIYEFLIKLSDKYRINNNTIRDIGTK